MCFWQSSLVVAPLGSCPSNSPITCSSPSSEIPSRVYSAASASSSPPSGAGAGAGSAQPVCSMIYCCAQGRCCRRRRCLRRLGVVLRLRRIALQPTAHLGWGGHGAGAADGHGLGRRSVVDWVAGFRRDPAVQLHWLGCEAALAYDPAAGAAVVPSPLVARPLRPELERTSFNHTVARLPVRYPSHRVSSCVSRAGGLRHGLVVNRLGVVLRLRLRLRLRSGSGSGGTVSGTGGDVGRRHAFLRGGAHANWRADLTHVTLSPRRGTAPTQCAARPAAHCVEEHRQQQPANAN